MNINYYRFFCCFDTFLTSLLDIYTRLVRFSKQLYKLQNVVDTHNHVVNFSEVSQNGKFIYQEPNANNGNVIKIRVPRTYIRTR